MTWASKRAIFIKTERTIGIKGVIAVPLAGVSCVVGRLRERENDSKMSLGVTILSRDGLANYLLVLLFISSSHLRDVFS